MAGSFMLWNCESEADNLGSQFFEGASAEGVNKAYDVIAYNISNNDTIRSDASKLTYATLGAFNEPQFGLQKSSYVTQARLSTYNPDFGTNPVVDSVVLEIKPVYPTDSVKTVTDDKFVYPDGNVEAKKVTNTYPVTKYGNKNLKLTVNVHEVTDFLGAPSDIVYSDQVVNYSTLLGSKQIGGTVTGTTITKKTDNSELYKSDPYIRVNLDKNFFQNKIIAKKGQPELSDASNFIRYFKGIRISVAENDGYIFKFTPNDTQIKIYYKSDVTSNGTTKATAAVYPISLGSGNVHFNQIANVRTGTPSEPYGKTAAVNYQTGDKRLYAQGMGGPSVGIRIPAATVAQVRELYKTQKIGILSAKIKLYADTSVWNNSYEKPTNFTSEYFDPTKPQSERRDMSTFLSDLAAFSANGAIQLIKGYNLDKNPAYYELTVTQTFKDIIEKSEVAKDIALSVGAYDLNSNTGMPVGQKYNTRVYTPNRIVLVGTDSDNPANPQLAHRAQLHIIYSTKKTQ